MNVCTTCSSVDVRDRWVTRAFAALSSNKDDVEAAVFAEAEAGRCDDAKEPPSPPMGWRWWSLALFRATTTL
jgi:hypothetical protein